MNRRLIWTMLVATLLAAAGLLVWGCEKGEESAEEQVVSEQAAAGEAAEEAPPVDPRALGIFEALPATVEADAAKVALGNRLYHDAGLSPDGTISCASCHDIAAGGDDGLPVSVGINGQLGPINSPTVLNSSYNMVQFWDGRAADLAEQAAGPVTNPLEMGSNWDDVTSYLAADPTYVAAFQASYPDGITQANITDAIAEFERTLVTPNSRFDQYLSGNDEALTADERAGLDLFIATGCHACHNGVVLGGNSYQRMGAVHDYFADRGEIADADLGRFNVTGDEADRHRFKVPILRNIELTAPYFHDASADSLEAAIRTMVHYQLGLELADEQVAQLAAFLKTLTGEIPDVGM